MSQSQAISAVTETNACPAGLRFTKSLGGLQGKIPEELVTRVETGYQLSAQDLVPPQQQAMSAKPDVLVRDLKPEDEFLLLVSGGELRHHSMHYRRVLIDTCRCCVIVWTRRSSLES